MKSNLSEKSNTSPSPPKKLTIDKIKKDFSSKSLMKDLNDDYKVFFYNLPKAELHIHLEGALEPELMFELAHRNNIYLPYSSIEELKEAYDFKDLQNFLEIIWLSLTVYKTEQDFFDITWALCEKLNSQGVKHVELTWGPCHFKKEGIPFETQIDGMSKALIKAKEAFGMSGYLVPSV